MALNHVVPAPIRITNAKGEVSRGGPYVDAEGIPELCARGVMPMRFLVMRADYDARFAGCESAQDVNRVLVEEGIYGNG